MSFTPFVVLTLIALTVSLNLVRCLIIGWVEEVVVFEKLAAAMAASPSYFRMEFTTVD